MNEILLMLLIGIFGSIIGGIIVWFQNERLLVLKERFFSKPYVAILISRDVERDFNIPKDLRDGIDEKIRERGIGLLFRSKGKDVAIHFEDDHLDKEMSSKIIQKLIEDENCILLIANANSTLTNSNINELLNAKKKTPKIPLIMPIATDYSIIEKANENNYKGVLRMLPDNDKQAELIQRFISDKLQIKGHNVAIFGDDKNNLYSENMLDNVANRLRTTGNFVNDKIIGKSLPAPNELDNVVAVIYAGIPPRALSLQDDLQRLLKIGQKKIPLIMTDGCLGSSTFRPIQSVDSYILSPIHFEGLSDKSGSYKPFPDKLEKSFTY